MNTVAATARPSAGLERWGALAGVAFVVLWVIGVILFFNGTPDTSSAPAKIAAYYSDSGHRDKMHIGWILTGLALFFFVWFVSALRRVVRRLEGDDGLLTGVTAIGGTIFVALTLVAISVEDAIKTMSDDTYQHQVFPGLIHAADDAGWVLAAAGGAGLAAMIIASSLAALRARAVPSWLGWISVVVGILSLALIAFIPWFLVLIWVLVVSIGLFLRAGRTATSAI